MRVSGYDEDYSTLGSQSDNKQLHILKIFSIPEGEINIMGKDRSGGERNTKVNGIITEQTPSIVRGTDARGVGFIIARSRQQRTKKNKEQVINEGDVLEYYRNC